MENTAEDYLLTNRLLPHPGKPHQPACSPTSILLRAGRPAITRARRVCGKCGSIVLICLNHGLNCWLVGSRVGGQGYTDPSQPASRVIPRREVGNDTLPHELCGVARAFSLLLLVSSPLLPMRSQCAMRNRHPPCPPRHASLSAAPGRRLNERERCMHS